MGRMPNGVGSLPEYAHGLFSNSPLELAIAQVRFPTIEAFNDPEPVRALQRAFRTEYPHFRREPAFEIRLTPTGAEPHTGSETLRFDSLDRTWTVVVTGESVSLETREYTHIQEFSARLVSVLSVIERVLEPQFQTRFGLRYINEIRNPDWQDYSAWRRLLNPALLPAGVLDAVGGDVVQTISEIRTQRDDGSLLMRYGFLAGTTVMPQPDRQPDNGQFFLLDMDYSDSASQGFQAEPSQRMIAYNDVLYRLFRWAIREDDLFDFLGGTR